MEEFITGINIYSLIAVIIKIIVVLWCIIRLYPIMLVQVMRPKDFLTRMRWYILSLITVFSVLLVPSIIYQVMRMLGMHSEVLENSISIITNLAILSIVMIIDLILNYKRKDS